MGGVVQKILVVIASILAAGCTAKYAKTDVVINSVKLDREAAVIVATPIDGRYESKIYQGSGVMTAAAVRSAFSQYSHDVRVEEQCRSINCLRQPGFTGYYVIPEILHWEDRATEWSGIPDKIQVKLSIYGGEGFIPLTSVVLSGTSKWATFGGDHPQDLLEQPVMDYVAAQY